MWATLGTGVDFAFWKFLVSMPRIDMRRALFIYDGKMNGVGCDLDTEHMLRGMKGSGWEVDFVSRGRVDLPQVRSMGMGLNPSKLVSWMSSKVYYSARRRWLSWLGARMLKRGGYDVAVAWGLSAGSFFRVAKEMGVRRILHCGNVHIDYRGRVEEEVKWPMFSAEEKRREIELADRVAVPSEFCRGTYVTQGVAGEKVVSLVRGADLSKFFPTGGDGVFRVICCGRVCERKGQHVLVKAWQKARLEGAELWLVGDVEGGWPLLEEVEKEASVRLWGFQEDVASLMRQCCVQVLMSENEGLAKGLIEGAACGLATVCTPESGLPVREGETGFMLEHDDVEGLTERLRRLHEDRELMRRMGEGLGKEAREYFTWERFGREWVELLDSVVES